MRRYFVLLLGLAGCGGPLTIAAAGDLQLGAARTADPLGALPALLDGEVRLVNLEGPLDEGCASEVHGRAAQAAWLRRRVDVVSLANNHRDDCGQPGRAATSSALAGNGVHVVDDVPLHLVRRGRAVTILARHYPPNDRLDDPGFLAVVRREAARALVVVSLHWGHTGVLIPTPEQRAFARALVAAGARIILGHGPHTPMGVERIGDAVVAYSLGNLAFDCACTSERDAYVLLVRVDRDLAITLRPLRAGLGEPPARAQDAELRELLTQLSADLGTTLVALPSGDLAAQPGAAAPHQAPSVAGSAR